jgi:CheY-like chemotaxis protein
MNTADKSTFIVCVDDEPRVLDGLKLTLRRRYEVATATSALDGLALLEKRQGAAVVVSDMRMPGMDGAAFLARVCERWPDSTRILLTGETGRDAAVAAVNEGQIFRFLTKPCVPDKLLAAIEAAVRQHELVTAERVLLQKTVLGSIRALVDILGIVNPIAFGRGSRIKRQVVELAAALGLPRRWELEAAALLSQIGYVSLPPELVDKAHSGEPLNSDEQLLLGETPKVAQALLARIPRLENVAAILVQANRSHRLKEAPETWVGQCAAVLLAVLEFDTLVSRGESAESALATLRARSGQADRELLAQLAALQGVGDAGPEVREIRLGDVKVGMILMDDVRTDLGTLLVARGYEVSQSFIERMRNFGPGPRAEKVRVRVSRGSASGRQTARSVEAY